MDMEFELDDGRMAEGTFHIEPYSKGGWEEAPSWGCATLEKVVVDGKEIPAREWIYLGLDKKAIAGHEKRAYECACDMRDEGDCDSEKEKDL